MHRFLWDVPVLVLMNLEHNWDASIKVSIKGKKRETKWPGCKTVWKMLVNMVGSSVG